MYDIAWHAAISPGPETKAANLVRTALASVMAKDEVSNEVDEWEVLVKLWSDPEARVYLSQPAPRPLPRRGRLHQLLARTQQVVRTAIATEATRGRGLLH